MQPVEKPALPEMIGSNVREMPCIAARRCLCASVVLLKMVSQNSGWNRAVRAQDVVLGGPEATRVACHGNHSTRVTFLTIARERPAFL